MLTLDTKDYGLVEYEKSDLLDFPEGIFGFTELKKFIPLLLDEN